MGAISKGLVTDEGRECTKCGKYQTWSGFHKSIKGCRGYESKCKSCSFTLRKNYYDNNKDYVLKRQQDWLGKYNEPGVYQLHTDKGRYIGQSKTMYNRVSSGHKTKNQVNATNAAQAKVLSWEVLEYIEDRQLRLQREKYWIKKLQPELNTYDK